MLKTGVQVSHFALFLQFAPLYPNWEREHVQSVCSRRSNRRRGIFKSICVGVVELVDTLP